MINYHRNYHPEIPSLYIFRNPVSFYYTWIKKWKEYGKKRYQIPYKEANPSTRSVQNKMFSKMLKTHSSQHPSLKNISIEAFNSANSFTALSDEKVFDWFKITFMSSLYELAQSFDADRDCIISFEHFFNNPDRELERIFNCLDVPVLKTDKLKVMDRCNVCYSEKVITKKMNNIVY